MCVCEYSSSLAHVYVLRKGGPMEEEEEGVNTWRKEEEQEEKWAQTRCAEKDDLWAEKDEGADEGWMMVTGTKVKAVTWRPRPRRG